MTKEELKAIREKLAYSQEEFGRRLGINTGSVWRYENGKSLIPPSVTTLAKIIVTLKTRGLSEREKLTRIRLIVSMDKDLEE